MIGVGENVTSAPDTESIVWPCGQCAAAYGEPREETYVPRRYRDTRSMAELFGPPANTS